MKRLTIEFEIDNENLEYLHSVCKSVEEYTDKLKTILLRALRYEHDNDIEYLSEELMEDKREYNL